MKHITILATPGINIGSIDNPRRAFLSVNEYLENLGEPPFFKISVAGSSKEIPLDNGLCTLHADVEIKDVSKTDLIIIPAFEGDLQKGLEQSSPFIPWIIHQYNHGAEIASLCVGAFLLAASGLLNGKSCSTHWRAANEFKRLFPDVQVLTEKVITDEQGIYTSGGAFSSGNLV